MFTEIPFDRYHSRMNEFIMLTLPDGYHGIYLRIDHLLTDSCGVIAMANDVMELYCHFVFGTALPAPMLSYRDAALKDLEKEADPVRTAKDAAFWEAQAAIGEPIFTSITGPDKLAASRLRHGNPSLRAADRQMTDLRVGQTSYFLEPDACQRLLNFCEAHQVSIVVKLDKTVPSGDIEIEESSVKQFINTITFGLFFNKNVDVTIKGTDDLSGVAAVEYYRSEEILTEAEVLAIKDWTAYTSVSETAEDAKQFVYYVKITDNAGNITYFGSNGTIFDLTAPVIAGVTDGATYYTTQSITVTDENFASVTVNGDVQSDSTFTLPGNVEKAYTIVATDKAGNSTTVMVTMKTITSLTEPMEGITTDNVTSADKETIEAVKEQVEAIDTENAKEDEKAVIDEILNNCDDLLEKIEESTQAGTTESIEKVENITSDNVKPEDKDDLTQAKEDLEDALENFGDNYTEEEKAELEEKLEQIEDALESIEKVDSVEDAINALPDTVEPDDTETEATIDEVKDLYDELTEHEKDLISEELKDKLDNLLAALCDYEVVKGDGSKWEKGSDAGLVFTANGAYSKFTGIAVDGKLVDKENYTAVSGSTVITLKPEFLETLSAGTHKLTVQYTDGEVSCEFTVVEKSAVGTNNDTKSPLTGNSSDIIPWAAFLLLMGGALSTNLIISKRKLFK